MDEVELREVRVEAKNLLAHVKSYVARRTAELGDGLADCQEPINNQCSFDLQSGKTLFQVVGLVSGRSGFARSQNTKSDIAEGAAETPPLDNVPL